MGVKWKHAAHRSIEVLPLCDLEKDTRLASRAVNLYDMHTR